MDKPLSALGFDIETGPADDKYVEAAMKNWTPPGNIKDPDKIEARRLEALAKIQDKASLLDRAPIVCVATYGSDGTMALFHNLEFGAKYWDEPEAEADMLRKLGGQLLNCTSAGTELVGHNLLGFDLPKLRLAYLRHGLALPLCLCPPTPMRRQPVFDTMREFRHFTAERHDDRYLPLSFVLDNLDIERPADDIDGSEVAQALADGRYEAILRHARLDVELNMKAYKIMTGQCFT